LGKGGKRRGGYQWAGGFRTITESCEENVVRKGGKVRRGGKWGRRGVQPEEVSEEKTYEKKAR